MNVVSLPFRAKNPMLAVGADMKGAFAYAKGDKAYLVDGFGDLSNPDNLERYERAIKDAGRKLKIKPQVIACDLHPDYFSTRLAQSLKSPKLCRVQHHEAHVASAIIDNHIKGDVIGVAFDGTGFGRDGNIWGGEFFAGNLKGFKRAGHLDYIAMPGGEAAIREPWRMAVSFLYRAKGAGWIIKKFYKTRARVIENIIDKGINSPLTSSAGRLFDAAASIILSKEKATFEAELPMALEKIAEESCGSHYNKAETAGIIKEAARDLQKGADRSIVSAKFHNSIAQLIFKRVQKISTDHSPQTTVHRKKINKVVLTGGVFQNRFLTERAVGLLEKAGFAVFVHSGVPMNDSGIPIGQIALAYKGASCV